MTRSGFTALVVEDEPLIALDTEDMLRALGATDVHIVNEFAAAKERLKACNYGIVVFDLDLGGISTGPLVTDYRELGCPAIVISGSDRQPADLVGVDVRMLTKPICAADLRGALEENGLTASD